MFLLGEPQSAKAATVVRGTEDSQWRYLLGWNTTLRLDDGKYYPKTLRGDYVQRLCKMLAEVSNLRNPKALYESAACARRNRKYIFCSLQNPKRAAASNCSDG
jgi:hypothetical protein